MRDGMVEWACAMSKPIERLALYLHHLCTDRALVHLDIPAHARELPGNTQAREVTIQVKLYCQSALYCHWPSKTLGVSTVSSFVRAPESVADYAEGDQATGSQGDQGAVHLTRETNRQGPPEVQKITF